MREFNHKHDWYPRNKYDKPGWYITGVVCSCGAKEYIDLLKGLPNESKETQTPRR